jgi:Glycosyl hydrolase family 20, domain 2
MNKRICLILGGSIWLLLAPARPCSAQTAPPHEQFSARLIPKKGLLLYVHNIPITTGSEINFFTPDRKQHEYYFTWWEQDADSSLPGRDILFIGSSNTAIGGVFSLEQKENNAHIVVDCKRNDRKTGQADVVYTKLWLPYFTNASWKDSRGTIAYEQLENFYDTVLYVYSPLGNFRFSNSHPFRLKKDEQPKPGHFDYAKRAQHLLLYENQIDITYTTPVQRNFYARYEPTKKVIQIDNDSKNDKAHASINDKKVTAWPVFHNYSPFLLPRPISETYNRSLFYELPAEAAAMEPILRTEDPTKLAVEKEVNLADSSLRLLRELIGYAWLSPPTFTPALRLTKDSSLQPEHYRLQVNEQGINIDFADPAGWQHALYSLAQLIRSQNGKLGLFYCDIKDGPALSFRGIHMFTGPTSWELHKRMYDQVLLPLKMNKTVLQCEQATWTSFPQVHNSISISLDDLQKEFSYLRKKQVEPIPLIQSLGHMEWFFKLPSTRKWAVNPQYPYTLNPNKPAARNAILSIWNEAFSLLQPTTIHVGFDEIGMIGFQLPREREVSFFKKQLGVLHRYARSKNAALMIWGDMGLAPGEGPDACNGINPERSRTIRNSIPKGTWIADWHYLDNPDPAVYKSSLQRWKKEGFKPLASPWLLPNNVRGFTLAAIEEGAGLLQTTWADFESSEKNMLLNIEQFGAYVLALDYAWSGRKELPKALTLPYDPVKVWTQRFYGQPKPIESRWGRKLDTIISLQNYCTVAARNRPVTLSIDVVQPTPFIGCRLSSHTETILPEATPAGILRGYFQGQLVFEKIIRYGAEVRADQDSRPCYAHIGRDELDNKNYHLFFPKSVMLDKVTLSSLHPGAGLTFKSLILIE